MQRSTTRAARFQLECGGAHGWLLLAELGAGWSILLRAAPLLRALASRALGLLRALASRAPGLLCALASRALGLLRAIASRALGLLRALASRATQKGVN